MTPQEFAQRLNRLYAGTMMQDMEMLHAGEGRARGRVRVQASSAATHRVSFMPE